MDNQGFGNPPTYDDATKVAPGGMYPSVPPLPGGMPEMPYPEDTGGMPRPQPGAPPPPPMQTQQVVIVTESINEFGRYPVTAYCKRCQKHVMTKVKFVANVVTWIICGVLCFVGCWLCCCIPFCVDSCQAADHFCPDCGAFLGSNGPFNTKRVQRTTVVG